MNKIFKRSTGFPPSVKAGCSSSAGTVISVASLNIPCPSKNSSPLPFSTDMPGPYYQ